MKRAWFLVFALSMGLNAGLLYVSLSRPGAGRGSDARAPARDEQGGPGGDRREQPDQPPGDFESVIRRHLDKMTRDLQLDERQRSAIAKVHEVLLPRIVSERRDMEALRRDVASRYAGPTLDETEFRSLVRQISRRQTRLDSLITEAMLGEAAHLTHEQRQRYAREMPWGGAMPAPERPKDKRPENPPRGDGDRPPDPAQASPPDAGKESPPRGDGDRPPKGPRPEPRDRSSDVPLGGNR